MTRRARLEPVKRSRLEDEHRRRIIPNLPDWDEVEGWVTNLVRQHLWRTRPLYGLADLVQEAAFKYCYLRQVYWWIEEPAHFCALLKTAITRHVHDLANERTRGSHVELPEDEVLGMAEVVGRERWLRLLCKAPDAVLRFTARIEDCDPEELLPRKTEVVIDNRTGETAFIRETTLDRLARIQKCSRAEARGLQRKLRLFVKQLVEA